MTCGRADRIDPEAFLLGQGDADLDDFRVHYLDCDECAEKVASWAALEQALRDAFTDRFGSADRHPTPDALEEFAVGSGTVPDQVKEIRMHVEGCGTCSAEVELLQRYDVTVGLRPASVLKRSDVDGGLASLRSLLAAARARVSGAHPLRLASAVALVLVLFLVWDASFGPSPTRLGDESSSDAPVRIAPNETPKSALEGVAEGALEPEPAPKVPLVSEAAPSEGPDEDESPGPEPFQRQAEPLIAQAELPEGASNRDAERSRPEVSEVSEELLIAALSDLPPPRYALPEATPGSMTWLRQFGPTRSVGDAPAVNARAPRSHVGLTLESTPRLWWRIEEDLAEGLQVTIVSDGSVRPILRLDLPGPHRAGLHSLSLEEHGIRLEAGTDYRWFVAVLVDPNRPSRNPVSAGALRRIEDSSALGREVADESPESRGHALARLGIWYDAFDYFAELSRKYPDEETLMSHLNALQADPTRDGDGSR